MEEESAKRKERLQAMRMEAGQSNKDAEKGKESLQFAPGLLSNPLVDSSVTHTSHNSPRFDYYTDPLAAFSGNKKNVRTNQNNSKSSPSESPNEYPNKPRAMISPTNSSVSVGSYAQQQNFHSLSPAAQAPFGSPISRNHFPSGPQYYSSPSSNGSPLPMPPVPRFNHTPHHRGFLNPNNGSLSPMSSGPNNGSPPILRQHQQSFQSSPHHRGFLNPNNGSPLLMSSGPRFNTWSQPSPPQSGTQPPSMSPDPSNESPAYKTPDPRFSNTLRNDNSWSQQPHSPFKPASSMASFGSPEIHSQQLHQQDQSGSQRGNISSWLDPRSSPGGRGSPRSETRASGSPSYGSGGRGSSWSEPRGRGSGGRGQAGMNSRGRGGRGFGGSPSPDQVQGGRGSRFHASAHERPDLFVKKSMVEDPWKDLVPKIIDNLAVTEMFRRRGVLCDLDYSESCQSESISLKKPKNSQIKDDFRSGPSLAESLALSFSDAIREESCN